MYLRVCCERAVLCEYTTIYMQCAEGEDNILCTRTCTFEMAEEDDGHCALMVVEFGILLRR